MSSRDKSEAAQNEADAAIASALSHEQRADILEQKMLEDLNEATATGDASSRLPASAIAAGAPARPDEKIPTAAEIEAMITTRSFRRGVGRSFLNRNAGGHVTRLPPMPESPTLADFFGWRFAHTGNHCLQSANKALRRGADEEIVLACLLHDVAQEIMCADHGYYGAQLVEPYVSERVLFAIKYHQPLRFFPDEAAGYKYPDIYRRLYGVDYVPDRRTQEAYEFTRRHRWYDAAREVTVSDLYAFDPKAVVTIEPFADIIGRHFKQPHEGLGNDNSSAAHMWRTIANPDAPL